LFYFKYKVFSKKQRGRGGEGEEGVEKVRSYEL
jgi:hypothetical protein